MAKVMNQEDTMEWATTYRKEMEKEKRIKKNNAMKNMLDELKKKHLSEKTEELGRLKKRMEVLKIEIDSYK